MKQITANETIYRTAELFLKNENVGDVKDTIKLIQNSKNRSYDLTSKFSQVFVRSGFSVKYPETRNGIYEMVDTFVDDHNKETKQYSEVYGTTMRDFAVGDIIQIQEWSYNEKEMSIWGDRNRFFIIDDVDFSEFNFATGELL